MEPGRTLTLAERGGEGAEVITAAPGFRLVATMNPGGDFGKKELSPALTNRFTVVWVPALEDDEELLAILSARLKGEQARMRWCPSHTAPSRAGKRQGGAGNAGYLEGMPQGWASRHAAEVPQPHSTHSR